MGRNVIARGGVYDAAAVINGGSTNNAAVSLSYSNYDTEHEEGGGGVTDPGTAGDQTAAPLLDADGSPSSPVPDDRRRQRRP